jgi:hypothetical protein
MGCETLKENARRPNSKALWPVLPIEPFALPATRTAPVFDRARSSRYLKVLTVRAGSNHEQQSAARDRGDSPDAP